MVSNKKQKIQPVDNSSLEQLKSVLISREQFFTTCGQLNELPLSETINPGLFDLQLASVKRLGHRDKFPRSYDWENLIPLLKPQEELLWIVERQNNDFNIYLGLKSNKSLIANRKSIRNYRRRFKTICECFARRSFPDSQMEYLSVDKTLAFLKDNASIADCGVTCVTGIPSPKRLEKDQLSEERNEDVRSYAGLNDILEPLMIDSNKDFDRSCTLVFVLARAKIDDIRYRFEELSSLRTNISPFIEQKSSTSASITNEQHKDTNSSITNGRSFQESKNIGAKIMQLVSGSSDSIQNNFQWGRAPGSNKQESQNVGKSKGSSISEQKSESEDYTKLNATLQFLDKNLELSMQHLQQTSGTGGYYSSVLVYSNDNSIRKNAAQSICSTLSGTHSHIHPMQILPFKGDSCNFHFASNLSVHNMLSKVGVNIPILNCNQATQLFLLLDAEIPGCQLKRNVFYGRPSINSDGQVLIGDIDFFTPKIEDPEKDNTDVHLAIDSKSLKLKTEDLCSHLLIVGTTGSGKTERAVSILNSIPDDDTRIIVIETAKKTYRNKLFRQHNPLVYTLGDSRYRPLRINPFYFDFGTSLKRHISILADAISELLPVEALIGPKLREAVENCYQKCGWDIESGMFVGEGNYIYPDMILFNSEVHKICDTLKDYGAEIRGNYKGALLNRARLFIDDIYQDIFAFDGNKPFDELFPRDTIIEMEELPPSDINMPSFIISIILERLRAYQSKMQTDSKKNFPKKIILVIEEAHNILHKKFEQATDERQAGHGKRLIEQFSRLLQEGRSLGIGVVVVDQSAQYLADSVIANTNTKIIHRQEDGNEVETVGKALGLPQEEWPDLQKLDIGECILKFKSSHRPVKLRPIPKEQLVKEREWIPFEKTMLTPPYWMIKTELKMLNDNRFSQNQLIQLSNKLIESFDGNYELIRFLIGRFFIFQDNYNLAQQTTNIHSKNDLMHILLLMQPLNERTTDFILLLIHLLKINCQLIQNLKDFLYEKQEKHGHDWLENETKILVEKITLFTTNDEVEKIHIEAWREILLERFSLWHTSVKGCLNSIEKDQSKNWFKQCFQRSQPSNNINLNAIENVQLIKMSDQFYKSYLFPIISNYYAKATGISPNEITQKINLISD